MLIACQDILDSFEACLEKVSTQKSWFFLDSSDPDSEYSTVSILAWHPIMIITDVENLELEFTKTTPDNLFEFKEIPFLGGWLGYFGYESSRRQPVYRNCFSHNSLLPDVYFTLYQHFVVWDHHNGRGWHICLYDENNAALALCDYPFYSGDKSSFKLMTVLSCEIDDQGYKEKFEQLQTHICNGDIYQANLSCRFSAPMMGTLWPYYQQLRQVSPAPFSSFLRTPEFEIACASPERFVKIKGQNILTQPIKGTSRRSEDPTEDQELGTALVASEKNNAELMMIVDLMRHELSRFCMPGTVVVDALVKLETYRQVFHLVSQISGQLKLGICPIGVLSQMLPGGSITGAPKRRAIEILSELETVPRSIYTGSMGYFGFWGEHDFNIAIRTVYQINQIFYTHAGGGIVVDSVCEEEWEEIKVKLSGIQATLLDYIIS